MVTPDQAALEQALHLLHNDGVTPAERIHAVWKTGHWPASVFEHFACDCAERALTNEQNKGLEPDSDYWETLAIKRRWLRQEASDDELQQALAKAQLLSHRASIDKILYEAAAAVSDALRGPEYAVRAVAWAVRTTPPKNETSPQQSEAQWQLSHLEQMLKEAMPA